MLKIFCSVPTPGMAKVAEKLNISTTEVCNLYSLWQSKNNKPGVTPTINQLKELIDNNKEEIKAYRFAVPVYKVGNNIVNAHQSTVEVNDNNEFILHQIPDNISLNEVLNTWNTIPNSLKSVISDKKDLYTVELWQNMLLNSGDVEYDVQNNPNAGINSLIASINKLKEYKNINPVSNTEEKPYKEVDSFKSGQLASTHKTNGEIEISIKKYIGVDEFMNYFQGNEESPTSEQKKLVLKELEKKGITLDMIKKNLNTPDKVKQFIYLHELSHEMNFENDTKNYDRSNMNAKVNVDIETRATLYAWEQMFGLPASEVSIISVGWARTSDNGYEVSTRGDKRFSALVATFKEGTIIDGVDVGGRTIEDVYQSVIKKSRKGQAPSKDSKLYRTSVSSYTGNITPDANTIFVFGSNPEGRHGAGAARVAREQFGAIYGQGEGLQGNAYALPTKDLRVKKNNSLRSISPEQIIESIKKLYETARQNPDKQFKVAYRNTDKASLNGYTGLEMIDMFLKAGPTPANMVFSKEWVDTGKFDRLSDQNLFSDDVTVNDAMNNNEKDETDNVKKYCGGK